MYKYLSIVFILFFQSLQAQNILTLEAAIRTALENNYNVRIAQNETYINTANNTAGNAGMLPEISLNFGQAYNINNTKQEFFSGEKRQGDNVKSTNTSANILANWVLFDGLRMFVNRDKLREYEDLGIVNLRMQMENTVAQVMGTYLMIEHQIDRISTIKEAINITQERLDLAKLRNEIGTGSGIEVLQAEVDINSDSSSLINQLLILKNLKVELNKLMVLEPNIEFETTLTSIFPPIGIEEIMVNAAGRNKMLELANKNITLANLTIDQWKSNKYPTLEINGGYNFNRLNAEIGLLKFNQNAGFSFGLTGRWNLFNGFNNKREIQVAKLNLDSQKLQKEQIWSDLRSSIQTYYNIYENANKMIAQEEKSIIIAQRNLDITSEKMRIGTITSIELRQAQVNLIDTEFRKIMAENDSRLAMLELLRLSGGLLQNF